MLYFSYSKGTEEIKMKKYNLSEIMKNAWAMKKTNGNASFSDCLRKAWAKAKNVKKIFDGSDSVMLNGFQFALWEKYGKRRIYINNYSGHNKSNAGGYIDLDRGNKIVATGCVKFAALSFLNEYEIAA